MRELKKTLLRVFFVLEVLVFAGVYIFGMHGIRHIWHLKKENAELVTDIETIQTEVAQLESKIEAWHKNPFYQEKVAREQLQMARAGDELYYY